MANTVRLAAITAALLIPIGAGSAQEPDYYAGRTIEIIVGGSPGGGYDTYARVLANHIPRHIPGDPAVVVQNMPGAGSLLAAEYIYASAPKDGTVIGAVYPGALIAPLLDANFNGRYNPEEFAYLGTASVSNRVCATYGTSETATYDDALATETLIGADAPGGSNYDYTVLLANLTDARLRLIPGYPGSRDIQLAMERGEVDGICGMDWSSLKTQSRDLLERDLLNILVQVGLGPDPELTEMGVPEIWSYVSPENEPVMRLVVSQQAFGRPYILPPGTPNEQVEILRAAFDATMVDPDFLADAERSLLLIEPASGPEVERVIAEIYSADAELVERARAAIAPQ